MAQVVTKIGPADHGRRMSLAEFDHADVQEGYLYELSRGVITVSNVPNIKHGMLLAAIRDQLILYNLVTRPGTLSYVSGGSDCKMLLWDLQSERHPDLSIYKTAPPDDKDLWSTWVPELVIEVVSPGSVKRDYDQKREEYLAFGCKEYWIFHPKRGELLALRRSRNQWRERVVKAGATYRTPLLPGFALDLANLFPAS